MEYEIKKLNEQILVLKNEVREKGITANVMSFAENLAGRAKLFDGYEPFIKWADRIQYR